MTKFFSKAVAAKTATLLVVVVVASTLLLFVVYNNNRPAAASDNTAAWRDNSNIRDYRYDAPSSSSTTSTTTRAGGSSGKKNHRGLYSASVNSIAQQRQRQLQQQLEQRRLEQRRNQQQAGGERGGEGEVVTVGGWQNYNDMSTTKTTTGTDSDYYSNSNSNNPLYETEMTTAEMDDDGGDDIELYSSSPFRPRKYTGTGTSYLHFKNSKEKDTDGYTTFPPTFAPIVQQSGWFQPTIGPTLLNSEIISTAIPSSLIPTLSPTILLLEKNSRVPTKYPILMTLEPTKEEDDDKDSDKEVVDKEENEWLETDEPTLSPSAAPNKEPTATPTKFPTLAPSLGPSLLPTRLPSKDPSKEPTRTEEEEEEEEEVMTERPSKQPQREPTLSPNFPTSQPISTFSASKPNSDNDVDEGDNSNTFYCGSNIYEARQCDGTPCPNGISDCPVGFCYAVSECVGSRGDQPSQPQSSSPTPSPVEEEEEEATPQPSLAPAMLPTMEPTTEEDPMITTTTTPTTANQPSRSPIQQLTIDDFYCGGTYIEASTKCNNPCPTGSPTECPNNMKCYASTGCTKENTDEEDVLPMQEVLSSPPTASPSQRPSSFTSPDSFYCGSSFQEAAKTCDLPCPTGLSAECPPNMACYANTPCQDKGGFYCGTSIVNASASCDQPCSSGLDSECALGLTCYETQTCQRRVPPPMTNTTTTPSNQEPKIPNVEDGTKYCGTSYEHASTTCTTPCPHGKDDCPDGMSCYAHTPCEEKTSFYCGLSWNNAASSCQLPCPTGSDDECPAGTHCYAYTTCDKTETFMCGTTFEEASTACNKPCPSGKSSDCPDDMSCFTHTTCSSSGGDSSSPPTGPNPTSGDDNNDQTSSPEGDGDGEQTSPPEGDGDGEQTSPPEDEGDGEQTSPDNEGAVNSFPPTATPEEYIPGDSYYCGTSFLDASMQCTHPCPSRSDSECPSGEQCYGNTPCPTRDTYYCGANLNEASSMCEFPCPSGKSADCPTGLSCFAFTTCADKDTFYCGSNFVEAGSNCDSPCPSGLSSECPENLTCFAHTQCAKEPMIAEAPKGPAESNFCGATFDEATRDCSLPCPTGSECPSGLTCFSHTSCADRDSFMCGNSWDHASATCSNPCPSGEHSDCPNGMRCFAYTPCNNAGSFYCGTSFDTAASCEHPCPTGSSDECPDNLSCFSYTSCGTGDFDSKPPTTAPTQGTYEIGDSFYCGETFQDASSSCEHKCPNGSEDCPDGLKCFEFTTCVGREDEGPIPEGGGDAGQKDNEPVPEGGGGVNASQEEEEPIPSEGEEEGGGVNDSYFCGMNLVDANEKCQVPCKDGTSDGCPPGESCIPFTTCNEKEEPKSPPSMISNSFYCGKSKKDAEASCDHPCPRGSSDCPDDLMCFSFTTCASSPNVPSTTSPPPVDENTDPNSFFCGTSFEDATSTCGIPCDGGSSSECPDGQSCYGYTSCNDRESFYCGKSWEHAASQCSKPCPAGSNDECDADEACFGYTPCNSPDLDIPVESFYCGATFEEASMMCKNPCPSGKNSDCASGELCHPYTPCGERHSNYCGSSWVDASTSCLVPCPSGSSADCPEDQFCFPSTPCDEVDSFFCGSNFEDATTACSFPCTSGRSDVCPDGQGCFAYTLCSEFGTNAVPTPTLAPTPIAPPDSFYCGASFDEASAKCEVPCPSGSSDECPEDLLCFASTPCSDKGSFFCGDTWELAAATCTQPCESGLSSDCPNNQQCFGYTPCTKSESFFCGTSFDEASTTCSNPCPSGLDSDCPDQQTCFKYTPCNDIDLLEKEPSVLPYPVDTYFCGNDFVDASTKCEMPCRSGSAAECPVGQACFGNTVCGGDDSFYCGLTWLDASSECKDPCATDEDCPQGSKCFGYTSCSNTDSFYCGTDFKDAASTCSQPCPSGLSSDCPSGLACFPNTPCAKDPSATLEPLETMSPTVPQTKAPTRLPTSSPTLSLLELKGTTAPSTPTSQFCGLDVESIDCSLPCTNDAQCPLDHECHETQVCDAQPKEESTGDEGYFYCGKDFNDASTSCPLACPSGSSAECADLGPEYSCFSSTPCGDKESYFCGTTWSHAASNCLFPCASGLDSECPDDTFCFPYTSCDKNESFMCGTSFEDASSCVRPCPSGSSSECAAGESCFTRTTCGGQDSTVSIDQPEPSSGSFFCGKSFGDATSTCKHSCPSGSSDDCPGDLLCFADTSCEASESFFCGATFEAAATSCTIPCKNGLSSDCPIGEKCYGYTPCTSSNTFFCGLTFEEAADTCDQPCPSGLDSECSGSATCHKYTTCAGGLPSTATENNDVNSDSFFCGFSFQDASDSCEVACPSGSSSDCGAGQKCFPYTTCSEKNPETYFCGATFSDANLSCTHSCSSSGDCPDGESCFAYTTCVVPEDHQSIPDEIDSELVKSDSFFCGFSFQDASDSCEVACPSGSSSDCGAGQKCFPHTTCSEKNPETYFCGATISDANLSCTHSCSSSGDCPDGESCFAYTTCVVPKNTQSVVDEIDSDLVDVNVSSESNLEEESTSDSNLEDESMTSFSSEIPSESYYCGTSYEHASSTCSVPCPDRDSSKCPDLQQCFAYTPCAKPESFFCGNDLADANKACAVPCRDGSSCPNGQSCYAYTECEVFSTNAPSNRLTSKPTTRSPTRDPTARPTTAQPTPKPTFYPTEQPSEFPTESPTLSPITSNPTEFPTNLPTKFPTNIPTKSPIIPVFFDVPEDSFYCGVTFNHASELCDVPCPGGDEDCPNGLTCFGNTPCGDKSSFFCGTSYENANSKCTAQCQHGSANECPSGESCFAYTECKIITEMPTEQPTDQPSFKPTKKPTSSPIKLTSKPSLVPTLSPVSEEPTLSPVAKVVEPVATSSESDEPVEIVKEPEEEEETVEEEEEPVEEEEEPVEEEEEPVEEEEEPVEEEEEPVEEEEEPVEEEEEPTEEKVEEPVEEEEKLDDESAALVIELKPCEDPLSMTVNQAYWRSWSSDLPETCNKFEPSDIDASTYTHLVYSFASISADGHLEPWVGSWDEVDKYREFNKVKERNPNVKTLIAVTAGVFYGAGMTPITFNEVAETEKTRMAFAQSVVTFLELYEFDGIDIDWETPLSEDSGGSPENYERFVALAEEIRLAFESSSKKFIFTITLPPTDWELLDYDVVGLSEHVDWFNLMSFDYHTPENIPKTVGAHSDLKLIDSVIFELLKDTMSTKFVLGMAAYGRTYTLADDRCLELGCPFRSPGLGGCGNTPGFLPFNEIHEYIQSNSYDAVYQDVSSSSMVAVVGGDQMISYDDETTWSIKEAYAEMMCLRGTMLWSIDMLKAKSSSLPQVVQVEDVGAARSLSTANSPSERCTLCSDGMFLRDGFVDDNGVQASCSDIHNRLDATFVPILSDRCIETVSKFGRDCCIEESFRSCDICDQGGRTEMLDNKSIVYAGSTTTCRALSDSFHHTKGSSFRCSLARSLMTSSCCAESCNVCPSGGEIMTENTIELDGKKVGCADAEISLKRAGVLNGSDQCSSFVSRFSDMCCSQVGNEEAPSLVPELLSTPCNVCLRNHIHHELNSEAVIEYKGSSISCLDLNSILARNEFEASDTCSETQSELFESCCYEKCSLCGDKSLRWDSTVKFNDQIISCHELGSMFTLGTVREGSDQCDAIQSEYSGACCYSPPTQRCNLCDFGSVSLEVNAQSFVKINSSSIHCMNLVENLAEREEEGSQVCEDSKLVFSTKCCNTSQSQSSDDSYYVWLSSHLSGSSSNAGTVATEPLWFIFVMTQLLFATYMILLG